MAAGLGNIAAAMAGDHRRNLEPILLEFDGIGDDMFGDVVDGHWFLHGACCIDDKVAVRRVGKGASSRRAHHIEQCARRWWARLRTHSRPTALPTLRLPSAR